MKPLAPNTLLQNRYLIVQLIGKGGMGEVYLAVDQRLGSAVALKRTFFSDDEMLGTAFEREARTLARLRHSVLPKVSDHFTENDTQYLVMEHITGDDLAKRLEITNKPFPLNWVLFWADQLLDALAYLHSHEPPIVHRDIKPQNLKLTDENHIVLLDFGLAKNSTGNTKVSSTTGGSIVGYTPHYAPMEQIRGTGTNPRSDIYSFAATFYQLLTNVVPPDALSRADNVLNGVPDPTKPLYEVNPEVPRAISDVILKGMALSMEQRYGGAREMQKALREAYAQMQNAMSAQTMAFNVTPSALAAQNQSLPQSQQQTEQFSTSVADQYPPASSAQNTQGHVSNGFDSFSEGNRSPSVTQNPSGANNYSSQPGSFDETFNDGAQSIGVKTEVLPKEKMPSLESYSSSAAAPPQQQEDRSANQFSSSQREDFNPDATIAPLVNFGNPTPGAQAAQNYNSLPKGEAHYGAGNTFPPNQDTAPAAQAAFHSQPGQPGAKKKSGGKTLAIAGGIGGLGVVAVGAAAIGWYALKPSQATVQPSPTPAAAVEATVEPTVVSTPVLSMEADPNAANTSTEATSATPEESTDVSADGTKEQKAVVAAEKTPAPQNVQPSTPGKVAPTPRVVTAKTPPPAAKTPPAAAKTPAKPNPTDILQ